MNILGFALAAFAALLAAAFGGVWIAAALAGL